MSKQTLSKKDLAASLTKENSQALLLADSQEDQSAATSKLEDFKLVGRLGDGAYSQVYKVKRIHDNQVYALKKVRLNHLSEKERDNAINEVRILASIKHKNVISYKEAFIEPTTQSLWQQIITNNHCSIVMEYADGGDLFQKICDNQQGGTSIHENEIWQIFIQIVRGLRAMHDLNVMHRDLKSANVFLNKDLTVKLGDMNVSKVANQRGLNYTQTGTPYYASPEVWKDEPYDVKSDIWSLGCVLYEIICLKPPFQANDMNGLYKRVIRGQFPRIPKTYSNDLWNVVKTMLNVDPRQRPDCKQIINMASFQKKSQELFPDTPDQDQSELLKTIRIPKNLMYLSNRLPMPNYEKMMKRQNTFKMNRSINISKHSRVANQQSQIIQNNSIDMINQSDIKLPNVQNSKILMNDRRSIDESSSSLPKISSKAKLAALEQQQISLDHLDKKPAQIHTQGEGTPSKKNYTPQQRKEYTSNISPKKLSNPKLLGSIDPNSVNFEDNTQQQKNMENSSMILVASQNIVQESPYNEENKDQQSTIVHLNQQNLPKIAKGGLDQNDLSLIGHKRDISNPTMVRDNSLKKLNRDKSGEISTIIQSIISTNQQKSTKASNQNDYKVSQQKLQDVYNIKSSQTKQQALMQAYKDKKKLMNSLDPVLKSQQLPQYVLISSTKINQQYPSDNNDDNEPAQPIMKPVQHHDLINRSLNNQQIRQLKQGQQPLFHNSGSQQNNGTKHQSKKSVNYAENLLKVASVYSKASMSPIQRNQKNRDLSQGNSITDKYNSVSNSLSNVKLPQLNNKSIILSDIQESHQTLQPYEYQPYENTYNRYSSNQKIVKKNQIQMSRNLIKETLKETPYLQNQYLQSLKSQQPTQLNKQYHLKTKESNRSGTMTQSESLALLQVNIKASDASMLEINNNSSNTGTTDNHNTIVI